MARNSESNDRRRSVEQRSNPALVPSLIALVLIVGAVAAALMTKRNKDEAETSTPKLQPFADMPPEAAPAPRVQKPGSNLPPAPDSIATEPQWLSAQVLAAEGRVFYDAAVAAKSKGDLALAREQGILARDKYDTAVEQTADWEETILSQYNEYDSKVRSIKDARSDWFNKLLWLKKSVGH